MCDVCEQVRIKIHGDQSPAKIEPKYSVEIWENMTVSQKKLAENPNTIFLKLIKLCNGDIDLCAVDKWGMVKDKGYLFGLNAKEKKWGRYPDVSRDYEKYFHLNNDGMLELIKPTENDNV